MLQKRKYLIILWVSVFIAASLACNLPGLDSGNQPGSLPVSTQAAGQLEDNLGQAADALLDGKPFSLSITEVQATSIVNLKLQSMQENRLQNLQIYLRDGQIQIVGDATTDGITLPVKFAAEVYASQGSIAYNILDAQVGPFALPDSILDQLEAQLDQLILGQLNPSSSAVFIEEILIANGVITINGRAR